jgi:hypothetical protein
LGNAVNENCLLFVYLSGKNQQKLSLRERSEFHTDFTDQKGGFFVSKQYNSSVCMLNFQIFAHSVDLRKVFTVYLLFCVHKQHFSFSECKSYQKLQKNQFCSQFKLQKFGLAFKANWLPLNVCI